MDIGCGSGLSGEILTEEGYNWIGMDISPSMLATGLDRDVEGDLFLEMLGMGSHLEQEHSMPLYLYQ